MAKIMQVNKGKLEGYTPEEAPERGSDSSRVGILSLQSQKKIIKAIEVAQKQSDTIKFNGGKSEIFNPITKGTDSIVNGEFGPLILKVKRGKRALDEHFCAQCREFSKSLWRYQDSNYGVVYLCNVCKVTAFERTFGHADAMPLKINHAHAHQGKW